MEKVWDNKDMFDDTDNDDRYVGHPLCTTCDHVLKCPVQDVCYCSNHSEIVNE